MFCFLQQSMCYLSATILYFTEKNFLIWYCYSWAFWILLYVWLFCKLHFFPFLLLQNSDLAVCCSIVNIWQTSAGWKRKVVLFRRLATWGEGRLVSKNQLWRFCSTMKVFKGRIIQGGDQSVHYLPQYADFLLIVCWWGNREGRVPGILCSGWSYHPPPGWQP